MRLQDYRPVQQARLARTDLVGARVPAIDAHAHLGRWLSGWVGRPGTWLVEDPARFLRDMGAHNVTAFINLDGRWGGELRDNLERYDHSYPGRVATFCHVDWRLVAEPNPTAALTRQLAESKRAGAAGVKVWKDLGLAVRDGAGRLVMPDDEILDDLWSTIGEARLPVWWHVADPLAFFEPVDSRNENYELLAARPEWSYHGRGLPSPQRLMAAMESVVAAHPEIQFVAVHAGCAEDLEWVTGMLAAYPNLSIDIAARTAQLGRQPRATRALIERFPTRVLFGTDQIPPNGRDYPTYVRLLETADESFPHSSDAPYDLGRWTIYGLDLPQRTLELIYRTNVRRLVPQLGGDEPERTP